MAITTVQNSDTSNSRLKRGNIVKPQFESGGGGILWDTNSTITVRNSQGNVLETLRNPSSGREGYKYPSQAIQSGAAGGGTFEVDGVRYTIPSAGQRGEYNIGTSSPVKTGGSGSGIGGSLGALPGGFVGGSPANLTLPGGARGGQISGVSAYPYYLSNGYPDFPEIGYTPIESAPYNKTNALDYAKSFGDFNRSEVVKNYQTSKDLALDTIDTELQGIQNYFPEMLNTYRSTLAEDNRINQEMRTNQIDSVLPRARDTLEAQRQRAEAYASGRLPDAVADRALALNIGSRGADQGIASGFGAGSAQTRKLQDLMSAEQRFQIAQYGEGLVNNNLATTSSLYLAPLEYGEAAKQVRLNPEVGAGRTAQSIFGATNSATLLSPGQAFQTEVQQEQFITGQEQNTRQFNASNQLNADSFNANGVWQSKVGQFNYDASYLSAVQGANQANLNFAAALMLQGLQTMGAGTGIQQGQQTDTVTSGLGALGSLLAGLNTNSSPAGTPGNNTTNTGNIAGAGSTSTTPSASGVSTQSVPEVGSTVGQTATDTSSSNSNQDYNLAEALKQPQQASLSSGGDSNPYLKAASIEPSSPGGIRFAADTPVPSGYVPTSGVSNGTYAAAPISEFTSDAQEFARSNSIPVQDVSVKDLAETDSTISQAAGITYVPTPGYTPIGLTSRGRTMYANPAAASSTNDQIAQTSIAGLGVDLASLGIDDPALHDTMSGYIAALDGTDPNANLVENALKSGTPEGKKFAYGVQKLNQMDDKLSPGQRSSAFASLFNDYMKASTGKDLNSYKLPSTEGKVGRDMSIADFTKLKGEGANVKPLVRNYDQMSAFGYMAGKTKDPKAIYNINAMAGFTGFGENGASVPVNAQQLAKVSKASPEFGVGARVFNKMNEVPKGYKLAGKTPDGEIIALPENLARTYTGNDINSFKKATKIAVGQHKVQSLWEPVDNKGVVAGTAGGNAMISGLDMMMKTNPVLAGAMIAHSYFNNTMGGYESNG